MNDEIKGIHNLVMTILECSLVETGRVTFTSHSYTVISGLAKSSYLIFFGFFYFYF